MKIIKRKIKEFQGKRAISQICLRKMAGDIEAEISMEQGYIPRDKHVRISYNYYMDRNYPQAPTGSMYDSIITYLISYLGFEE